MKGVERAQLFQANALHGYVFYRSAQGALTTLGWAEGRDKSQPTVSSEKGFNMAIDK